MTNRPTYDFGGVDLIINNLYTGASKPFQLGTLLTAGGNVFIDVSSATPAIVADGTDQTSNLHTLLTALQTAGTGGILLFKAGTYKFSSAIVIPNDGGGTPKQVPIIFQGSGSQRNGQGGTFSGGTVFDIRTNDSHGHIQTYGLGSLTFRDMQITDGGNSSGNHFFYTTNTTLTVQYCLITGSPDRTGTTANQDVFILGGTSNTLGGGTNAPFQGYGTYISDNQFDRICRLAYIRVFANGIILERNYVERNSGNPSNEGALILIDGSGAGGTPANYAVGTKLKDNLIEICNYKYFAWIDYGEYTNIEGNNLFDETATTVAGVHMTTNASDTYVIAGLITGLPYLHGTTSSCTFISQAGDGTPSLFPAGTGTLAITGNFTATGQTCQIGTAGSTNNLQFLQSTGLAKISADGTDFEISNTSSGSMFFDNSGSGGAFWFRTTGFTTVLDYTHTNAGMWTFAAPIVAKNYTVSTLPTGVTGAHAYITDGDSGLAWGATAVNSGAGATKYFVWYNGANWTVVGK